MKKSRLIKIFSLLSKKEWKIVSQSIASDSVPLSQLAKHLFYVIESHRTLLENEDPYFIWNQILPNSTYNDNHFRKIKHDLANYIESIIAKTLIEPTQIKLLTAQWYKTKNEKELALDSLTHVSCNNDLEQLLCERAIYSITSQKRGTQNNLKQFNNQLDAFYVKEKLKLILASKTEQTISSGSENILNHETELLTLADHFRSNHLILTYCDCIELLKSNPNKALFFKIKTNLVHHLAQWNKEDSKIILTLILNYCIKKINLKEQQFENEAFELYKIGLHENLFLEEGILSPFTYKNTITLALKLKNYTWVETHIEPYSTFLEEDHQTIYKNFCYALLYFEQKQYKKAQKLLLQIDYTDEILSLNAKSMLIKIYYEDEKFDVLEHLLDSAKTYVQRKKLNPFYKEYFGNFIKCTKKLILIDKTTQLQTLKTKLEHLSPIASKEWLLEKINQKLAHTT